MNVKRSTEGEIDYVLHREKREYEERKFGSECDIVGIYAEYYDRVGDESVGGMFAKIFASAGIPQHVRDKAMEKYQLYLSSKAAIYALANVQDMIYRADDGRKTTTPTNKKR